MRTAVTHAWRAWKTGAGTAVLAACAFAIGIGGATAIYTVVRGVMLKPLPYADDGRLVALYSRSLSQPEQRGSHSIRDLLRYQQETRTFAVLGWFKATDFNITFSGQPEHVVGVAVTPALAVGLGVRPALGAWFHADTDVVVSTALARRLGRGPDIIGRSLTLDGRALTITGVMPPAFRLPVSGPGLEGVDADLWIPLDPAGSGQDMANAAYFSYARLQPGVSLDQANADVARVASTIAAADPAGHPSYTAKLDDLRAVAVADIRPTIVLLAASAALLFLIACADVAGLLLARALSRARDTAVRVALGASARQLAAQYFFEGLLVALPGAAGGIALSRALVRAILAIAADKIPRADEISVDWTVLLFAVGAAAIASGLAALAPLRHAARTSAGDVLVVGGRASSGSASSRLSRVLVAVEIALAFALVAAGAALVADLRALGRLPSGFDPDGVATFELSMGVEGTSAATRADRTDRFLTAIDAVPGVTSAAVSNQLPLAGCCFSTAIYPDGRPPTPSAVERTSFLAVSPDYQRTLRIPIVAGRFLDAHDTGENPLTVVVNEAAVRTYWPDGDAIGRYGRVGSPDGNRFQIVGVIGDIRNDGLSKPTVPEIYLSAAVVPVNPLHVVVRSTRPLASLLPDIRHAIAGVDSNQPIHDVSTLDVIRSDSMSVERVGSLMVGFFATAALVMAALGLYGVISYSTRQRTVEIGTRMALGASARDLLRMVFMEGLTIALYGGGAGAIVVATLSVVLAHAFSLPAVGVVPFVVSALVVMSIASSASLVPAARTALLPPIVAMRNDPGSGWRSSTPIIRDAWRTLARGRVSQDTAGGVESAGISIDMVTATRQAGSFSEAFEGALNAICASVAAGSALLLECDGGVCRCIAHAHDDAGAECTLPANGLLARRLRFRRSALPFDVGDLNAWRDRAGRDAGRLAEIETLASHGVRVAVAFRARRDITGMLLVGLPTGRSAYSSAERRALTRAADLLTMMLENARLTRRVVTQEKSLRDVALAAEVQKRLLPDGPPEGHAESLAGASVPARTIGGDYYDFLDLGERGIGIALADVSGKGVPAALIMAAVQSSLRIVASDRQLSLPELAAKLNTALHHSTRANSYATFFYAQVDARARQLRYVNAGHNPPYLLRAVTLPAESSSERAAIQELPAGGTVLGLFPGMSYEEATIDLRPGDVLVAFTDGVIEALNAAEQEFGEERLKDLLRSIASLSAPDISSRISEALHAWITGAVQYDDMTFVVMKVGAASSDAVLSGAGGT